jgi:hypothetical protein
MKLYHKVLILILFMAASAVAAPGVIQAASASEASSIEGALAQYGVASIAVGGLVFCFKMVLRLLRDSQRIQQQLVTTLTDSINRQTKAMEQFAVSNDRLSKRIQACAFRNGNMTEDDES